MFRPTTYSTHTRAFVGVDRLPLMGVVSANVPFHLVIFIIAAIITPTTDIMNMCIFAAPMILLYLVSIGVAFLVHPARRKKRAEAQ